MMPSNFDSIVSVNKSEIVLSISNNKKNIIIHILAAIARHKLKKNGINK